MDALGTNQPFFVLVDDDSHSSRLMIRMLLAHGAPSVSWLAGQQMAAAEIGRLLDDDRASLPALVIVDLKSSSLETQHFIEKLRSLRDGRALLIAAIAPSLEREVRTRLIDAGADAVFERQSDIDSFRREAAAIVSFWVRNQRLDAVGT